MYAHVAMIVCGVCVRDCGSIHFYSHAHYSPSPHHHTATLATHGAFHAD
jgi:hypothetical protein